MITLKTSRRRLQEDEEDSLLAGIDFQTHYLGHQEVFVDGYDIDSVVHEIYSQYSTNEDLNNSTLVAITVDPHQLEFYNVTKKELEFHIETPDIKSIHCGGSRPKKFPNAVVLVTCAPPEDVTKLHVIHCVDPRTAKKIYEAISRAFEYHMPRNGGTASKKKPEADASKLGKNNKIQPNKENVAGKNKVENKAESKASKLQRDASKVQRDASKVQRDASPFRNLSIKLTGFADIPANITKKSESEPDVLLLTRSKSRTKSSTQAKGVEGLGLLANVDPEEGFDDDFTNFARSRSASETFKLFGR